MSRHFDSPRRTRVPSPNYLTDQQWVQPASPHPRPRSPSQPYMPGTQISQMDLDLTYGRGTYQNFHKPWNRHNRFLADAQPSARNAYRPIERMAPPPFDTSGRYPPVGSYDQRPSSAPPFRPGSPTIQFDSSQYDKMTAEGHTLLDNMTTQTGAPCFTVPAIMEADLEQGKPLMYGDEGTEEWKVARVQAYVVPPSGVGYGEGGKRPFHQDYRHYKYYGFAGKGAKTSWAHNPKHSKLYQELIYGGPDTSTGQSAAPHPPLQDTIGGPRRPLTPVEQKLVRAFRQHSYVADGAPSNKESTTQSRYMNFRGNSAYPQTYTSPSVRNMEIVDPYLEKVDLLSREALSPGEMNTSRNRQHTARVITYRQPVPGALTLSENPSPNHGSQAPFHQRYGHYKYNGFAGKGATSSWARNPKQALLYDH